MLLNVSMTPPLIRLTHTFWLHWSCLCCRTFQRDHLWLSEHILAEHLWGVWQQPVSILSNLQPGLCPASSCDSDTNNLFHHSPAALSLGLPVTWAVSIVWLPHECSVGNVVVQVEIFMRGSKESWGNLYKPKTLVTCSGIVNNVSQMCVCVCVYEGGNGKVAEVVRREVKR
jgi:hypothetical protein